MMPQTYYRNVGLTVTTDGEDTTGRTNRITKIMDRSFLPSSNNDYQEQYYFYDEDSDTTRIQPSKAITIPKQNGRNKTEQYQKDYDEFCVNTTCHNIVLNETSLQYHGSNNLEDRYTLATWRMYDRIMQHRAKNQNVLSSNQSTSCEDLQNICTGYYNHDDPNQKSQDDLWSPDCPIRQCYMDCTGVDGCQSSDLLSIPNDINYSDDVIFDLDL